MREPNATRAPSPMFATSWRSAFPTEPKPPRPSQDTATLSATGDDRIQAGSASSPDRHALLRTIEALEGQRETLGDSVVDVALAPLRQRLAVADPAIHAPVHAAAERKIVTVLFVDVVGFTDLSERIGSEAT